MPFWEVYNNTLLSIVNYDSHYGLTTAVYADHIVKVNNYLTKRIVKPVVKQLQFYNCFNAPINVNPEGGGVGQRVGI